MKDLCNFSEEFEDCLITDDVFLSYFNKYLTLPAFAYKTYYNRLSGAFEALNGSLPFIYGPTEEERERMLKWAESERYVQFKRSNLYREMKLCKLLARPIEHISIKEQLPTYSFKELFKSGDTSAAKGLAGISRQSATTDNSDSTHTCEYYEEADPELTSKEMSETQSSEQTVLEDQHSSVDQETDAKRTFRKSSEYSKYFKIRRQSIPWATMAPTKPGQDTETKRPSPLMENSFRKDEENKKTRRKSEPIHLIGRKLGRRDSKNSDSSSGSYAPLLNSDTYIAKSNDFWSAVEKLLDSASADNNLLTGTTNTETNDNLRRKMELLEERQHIPFQRLKEILLSSQEGMQDFISYLLPTKGINLIDFWLDCETIYMDVENRPAAKRVRAKFSLLRELEDRYVLRLTSKARRHLEIAINTLSNYLLPCNSDPDAVLAQKLGELMFDRIQYDTLRHLRSYWLPCWLLHWEIRLKQYHFLPTTHGGSSLFYLPSINSVSGARSIEASDSCNYFSKYSNLPSGEITRTYSFSGSPAEAISDARDPSDEQEWTVEVNTRFLENSLSGKGLIEVSQNRSVLKNRANRHLLPSIPSTLAPNMAGYASGSIKSQLTISEGELKPVVYDDDLEHHVLPFKDLFLAWSIPCKPEQALALARAPGSSWETLRSRNLLKQTQLPESTENTTEQSTSVYIQPLQVALGLQKETPQYPQKDNEKGGADDRLPYRSTRLVERLPTVRPKIESNVRSAPECTKEADVMKKCILTALRMDAACGGPFQTFLERRELENLNYALGFVQAVHDLSRQHICPPPNRFTRLSKAWHIVNTFLLSTAPCSLQLDDNIVREVTDGLRTKRNHVPPTIFDRVQELCLNLLVPIWIEYLKHDALSYARASYSHNDELPAPDSPEDLEVSFLNESITIRRKPFPTLQHKAGTLEHLADWQQLSLEERKQRIRIALEQRRITERERKRALRDVRRRQKEEADVKKSKGQTIGLIRLMTDGNKSSTGNVNQPDGRLTRTAGGTKQKNALKVLVGSKILMNQFQKWLIEHHRAQTDPKEIQRYAGLVRQISFVADVTKFLAKPINRMKAEQLEKRVKKAENLYNLYLADNCPQPISISAKLLKKLQSEHERPSTATLKGIREQQFSILDPMFGQFFQEFADKLGLTVMQLERVSDEELSTLVAEPVGRQTSHTKLRVSYRTQPTVEDREKFEVMLASCAFKPLTFEVIMFYQYLVKSGRHENRPFIDQNLIFYIEALRYQAICRGRVHQSVVRQKAACILLTFLESVFPPQLQIELPSDVRTHLVQRVHHQLNNKTALPSNLFEDAAIQLFRQLLPYWAGFRRNVLFAKDSARDLSLPITERYRTAPEIPWLAAPLTYKHQAVLGQRLRAYGNWSKADVDCTLPDLPEEKHANTVSFSIKNGVGWGRHEE
ncbi:hypothetical protein EG68_00759 [Paragonimus skrjabini miyazakii]|uniref:RGS domain-containing protein n=1 Tax=Paragonimus skrjabini miyazakii TaxID=59628 RepID=A0A8S9Z9K5_9TREM|nr:hypothetical protein EG68_00759 [Paragonimus skrjabini miyazakii]